MKNAQTRWNTTAALLMMLFGSTLGFAAEEPIDPYMGDWQGIWRSPGGESNICAQVIALGNGGYTLNVLADFDIEGKPIASLDGTVSGGTLVFGAHATITADTLVGQTGSTMGTFSMKRVFRKSPTLGDKPPSGAVVLFDGEDTSLWQHPNGNACGWAVEDGVMRVTPNTGSIVTKPTFLDHKVHLEFRTPFMPNARGQGRGNSGVYFQSRYEVQILDSYGLDGFDNECGGIYRVGAPRVNMCYPPMQWQTYDVTFIAPRFDNDGKKVREARITVLHNGVEIHKDLDIPGPTAASLGGDENSPGGLYLQDHGNPVEYRNIWAVHVYPELPPR